MDPVTVHILRHGRSLCLRVHGIPEVWPKGHRWVPYTSRNVVQLANCPDCRAAFENIPAEQIESDLKGIQR